MNGEATATATVDSGTEKAPGRPKRRLKAVGASQDPAGAQKAAPRRSGIDWGRIRDDYEARLAWEKDQGLDPVELKARAEEEAAQAEGRPVVKKKQDTSGLGGRPKYDRAEIVRLYVDEGLTAPQIVERIGCNRQTVYSHLNAAGIERRDDRKVLPGPPRRTHCVKRGHEMNDDNTRVAKDGSRLCRKCEAIRQNEKRERKGGKK